MSQRRFFHININVTDLDRSIAFYERLGFKYMFRASLGEAAERTCAMLDMPPNDAEYAFVRIGDDPKATCLDLVQWSDTQGAPYDAPNNVGIFRFLVHVDDAMAVLDELQKAGIHPIGEVIHSPNPDGPNTVFCVRDPDGVVIEIADGLENLVN